MWNNGGRRSFKREDYTVGIICALPLERTAVQAMLDVRHDLLPAASGDNNCYAYGSIGPHNVVVASLTRGEYGLVQAAGVAEDIRRSFPKIRFGLMVGIAGAIPRPHEGVDIRLGDIIVGSAEGKPSVVNYEFGKATRAGFEMRTEFAKPPPAIRRAIAALEADMPLKGPTYLLHLDAMLKKHPRLDNPYHRNHYFNQPAGLDHFFKASFPHPEGAGDCQYCTISPDTVEFRDARSLCRPPEGLESVRFIEFRKQDADVYYDYPLVHYGTIASSNTLVKDGRKRDTYWARIKRQTGAEALCFEMEAAGIGETWPCLVIRGICDYSDSHKNNLWQNFAAATAAAYAKTYY